MRFCDSTFFGKLPKLARGEGTEDRFTFFLGNVPLLAHDWRINDLDEMVYSKRGSMERA
jgi:hypothetical protein